MMNHFLLVAEFLPTSCSFHLVSTVCIWFGTIEICDSFSFTHLRRIFCSSAMSFSLHFYAISQSCPCWFRYDYRWTVLYRFRSLRHSRGLSVVPFFITTQSDWINGPVCLFFINTYYVASVQRPRYQCLCVCVCVCDLILVWIQTQSIRFEHEAICRGRSGQLDLQLVACLILNLEV